MNERFIEGGKPKLNWDKQYPIEQAIKEGIEHAQEEGEVIDHRTARLIAEHLGTPGSALQTFAETGEVPFEHDGHTDVRLPCLGSELMGLVPVRPDKQPWLEAMAGYMLSREEDSGPVRGWHQLTTQGEGLAQATDEPKIHVVSVAEHQPGELAGAWIAADQAPDDLQAEITAALDGNSKWEIFDFTGFGVVDVFALVNDTDPDVSLETVSRVGQGIGEHGPAFAAYISAFGTSEETCEQFEQRYLGRWHHLSDYARHVADDLGWYEHLHLLPEWMRDYVTVDYGKLASHLASNINVVEGPQGMVYVFAQE